MVAIIALLVLGPERMPQAIRSLATWWGKFRKGFTQIKRQMEDEIGFDQIRKQLHEEEVLEEIKAMRVEMSSLTSDVDLGLKKVADKADETTDPSHWPGMPPERKDADQ